MATWLSETTTGLRQRASVSVRNALGLSQGPPIRCDDPELAYGDVDGVARVVHGDLASMLVGGLASLFFQMLHPHAMAGVAQHSRYRDDPLKRLLQTANFISATTYGSKSVAEAAIARVLEVHAFVHGVADDGVSYDANDPHLLLWVHCAEISMFLRSYQRFGRLSLSESDADRYVFELAKPARDLGVKDPPTTQAQLRAALLSFRPELRLSAEGAAARDFIVRELMSSPLQRMIHRLFVLSAWSLLAPWARELLGVRTNALTDRVAVRPATKLVCYLMRLAIPPTPRHVVSVTPPSTTTT